jgi:hypothetical protein
MPGLLGNKILVSCILERRVNRMADRKREEIRLEYITSVSQPFPSAAFRGETHKPSEPYMDKFYNGRTATDGSSRF